MFNIRRSAAVIGATALALSMAACNPTSTSDKKADAGTDSTVSVAASFYPIAFLAEQIGGDHVTVTSVTPTNVEPHDFELSPKDVTELSSATLIAYVPGFQPSLDDAVAQLSGGPTVLDLAPDVHLEHHEGVEEHEHEGHDHEAEGEHHDGDEHEGEEGEEHEHEGEHHHDGDADALDPHFWLDPVRMKDAAVAIEKSLAQVDSEHASDYKANLDALTAKLDTLNDNYSSGLNSCERTTFVTAHSAFGYLAERYGLTQASISGLDPEAEPSPAELAAVKEIVTSTGTTTIFTEELVSPKTAEALAAETGATTEVLNPIESQPEDGDYVAAMTSNLEALRGALSCK